MTTTASASGGERENLFHRKGRSSLLLHVKNFGARAEGQSDDRKAFQGAWKEAFETSGAVDLLILRGVPCLVPLNLQATAKRVILRQQQICARIVSVLDEWREGLTLNGGGTFNAHGAKSLPDNRCSTDFNFRILSTNVKFVEMNGTVVQDITSLNSKFFHIALVECNNFKGSKNKHSAPGNSPDTDGIHID